MLCMLNHHFSRLKHHSCRPCLSDDDLSEMPNLGVLVLRQHLQRKILMAREKWDASPRWEWVKLPYSY